MTDYDEKTGIATITQRNRFFKGDEIEIMRPMQPYFKQIVGEMTNEENESIDVANHPEMIVHFKVNEPVKNGDMLRRKKPLN